MTFRNLVFFLCLPFIMLGCGGDDPVLTVSISEMTVIEGDSCPVAMIFDVDLSGPAIADVTVDFASSDGTAMAGSDYIATSGTLTIPSGETSGTISVNVLSDTIDEADETFIVRLSNPQNAALGAFEAMGTITDDDKIPVISISGVTVFEGNSGPVDAAFVISLTNASSAIITVDYAVGKGTAKAGRDYKKVSGTLTIPVGDTSGVIIVDVLGDKMHESHETFTVSLSNPQNSTIGVISAKGIIIDDDMAIPATALVSETGQVSCYAKTGDPIACAGTGQDGELQRGIDLPTRRFTNNGDGTVTDNLTELMWIIEADCIGNVNHDFDNDLIVGDGQVYWQSALDFVAAVNAGTFSCNVTPAYTDWRLPNIRELKSLIDAGQYNPALSAGHPFSSVRPYFYWSSTSYVGSPGCAWIVDLSYGYETWVGKEGGTNHVWLVRAGNK